MTNTGGTHFLAANQTVYFLSNNHNQPVVGPIDRVDALSPVPNFAKLEQLATASDVTVAAATETFWT